MRDEKQRCNVYRSLPQHKKNRKSYKKKRFKWLRKKKSSDWDFEFLY